MVRRYSGPRGFSWKFSSRKSERADIARWQRVAKRRGERGVFFFLLASSGLVVAAWRLAFSFPKKNLKKNLWDKGSSPPFDTVICSFPGIASTTTNFHFVNGLVRHVPILIIDTKVQHLWIGSPAIFAGVRQRKIKQSHIFCESVRHQLSSCTRRYVFTSSAPESVHRRFFSTGRHGDLLIANLSQGRSGQLLSRQSYGLWNERPWWQKLERASSLLKNQTLCLDVSFIVLKWQPFYNTEVT